jgi:hypothetical protein
MNTINNAPGPDLSLMPAGEPPQVKGRPSSCACDDAVSAFENVPGPRFKRDTSDAEEDVPLFDYGRRRNPPPSRRLTAETMPDMTTAGEPLFECIDAEDPTNGPATTVQRNAA